MLYYDEMVGLVGVLITFYVFIAIISLASLVAMYVLYCFPQKAIANKVGLFDNWKSYVPVARSVQKAQIADMPTWKFMFLGTFTPSLLITICLLIFIPLSMMTEFFAFIALAGVLFIIVMNFICNYQYNYRLCKIFGFNTFLAFAMLFIPIYITIFTFLVVYPEQFEGNKDNLYTQYAPQNPPKNNNDFQGTMYNSTMSQRSVQTVKDFNPGIVGKTGFYAGQTLSFSKGEKIVLGRDKNSCSVIFSSDCTKISRIHCSIKYDDAVDGYIIEDYSSNGTFVNGQRLRTGAPFKAVSGSIVELGNNENTFCLV